VFATIIIVFLILVVLLRAIVAPLYLIGSVLLSYLSALGLGVILFQLILGQEMHWSLPGLSFILLVAVGADYNMLLISRIRDESPHGVRVGVIRTVGSTGGVITSAGLIFAASMFGLVSASINTMAQAGFTIGIGIVLDTFLVRTVTVPALAAMIGQANWWPSKLSQRKGVPRTQPSWVRMANRWVPPALRQKLNIPTAARPKVSVPVATRAQSRYPLYDLGGHALPLFGPIGLPHMTDDLRAMALASTTITTGKGDGKVAHAADDPESHPLPLFSLAGRSRYGEGNGKRSADDLAGHALPLFRPISVPADGNEGNTNGQ
jgi:RND superfamily putative drug exporter